MGTAGGALAQALLCVLSLGCAHRARQVTAGPAAGFLLQAVGAASDAVGTAWPWGAAPDPLPGSWVSAVLAQPMVAFGFHRLSGDRATANLQLAAAALVAAVAAGLGSEGRAMAAHGVAALTAGSVLALAALTASGPAALAAGLVALGELVPPAGLPWARGAASLALLWALQHQRLGLGHQ
ncbi:transmembrane protein 276 [Pithys albifrons albifrons]|uniref:transmembrane protein 276 n=1 Tax=Pithys albifrons albifrons TaxID=3385563 RepID=UPI003A5CE130